MAEKKTPPRKKTAAKRPRGRPRNAWLDGMDAAARRRFYYRRARDAERVEAAFSKAEEGVRNGVPLSAILDDLGLTRAEFFSRVDENPELARRWKQTRRILAMYRDHRAEELLLDRAENGYFEDAATPKGGVVSLHRSGGDALLRLYNEGHAPKRVEAVAAEVTGTLSLSVTAALLNARLKDFQGAGEPSPGADAAP
ncbi:MAG: hypothetical protein IK066_04560 [Kiritimatiellae bacterium]|nr:hypothetical protein [Kiritimatiellia bacterium]